MSEEDRVSVGAAGLHGADAEVLLGDRIRRAGAVDLLWSSAGPIGVIGVDLLAQHGAPNSAAGFALFIRSEVRWQNCVVEQKRPRGFDGQTGLAEILVLEVARHPLATEVDAGMEPALGV